MPAGKYNIKVEQGATYHQVLTWSADGSPVNLTGWTARMQVRKTLPDPAIVWSLTTENGGITLGGADGTVALDITATDTDNLPGGYAVYDLELVSPGGTVKRLLQGSFTVSPQVTR